MIDPYIRELIKNRLGTKEYEKEVDQTGVDSPAHQHSGF